MLRTSLTTLLIGLCTVTALRADDDVAEPIANDLLAAVNMPGQSSFIKWTNLRVGTIQPHSSSSKDVTSNISVLSPGYQGSMFGFYSWRGDFGYTASASTNSFAIKNVVFQSATMYNSDSGQSLSGYFDYKHTDHYKEDEDSTMTEGGSGSYGYSEQLGALDALVDGYTGGPVLTWTDAGGNSGSLTAHYFAHLTGTEDVETAHGTTGSYYNFAWQWDLSAIPNEIVAVEITVPLPSHSSTVGAQIDISDSFGYIIPEPTTYALLVSAALCGIVMLRRRNRK